MGFQFLKLRTMKKHIVFFSWTKLLHCSVTHFECAIRYQWRCFTSSMCCSKIAKSCVSRNINMAAKRSHSDRSMELKYAMFQDPDKATPQKDLVENYSVLKNTISTWKKNRTKILACYEKGLDSKRIKPEMYENIGKALMKWFLHLQSKNIPVNSLLLKEKVWSFAKELGVPNFKASDG